MARKKKSHPWFQPYGWFHLPNTWQALVCWALGAVFCINVTLVIAPHAQSVSDLVYAVIPYFICVFLLLEWVAGKTSK